MDFYISARTREISRVRMMYSLLEERGHSISYDWTQRYGKIKRPYIENPSEVRKLSQDVLEGIKNSDVFILLIDKNGTDMYSELASALSFNLDNSKPLIYIIGERDSPSIFSFNSSVKFRISLEDILIEIESNNSN